MNRVFGKEIMGFVPVYVDQRGNCTIVYIKSKEPFVLDKSIKTILRLIGKYYMIDLNEVKKRYSSLVSSPNLVPIPLSKRDVFVPFKTRVPMCKNDGAFGYINIRYIDTVTEWGSCTAIHLAGGIKIKCLSSFITADKHMRNGHIVSRCYEDRSMQVSEAPESYDAMIAATKADIDMLKREVRAITRKK